MTEGALECWTKLKRKVGVRGWLAITCIVALTICFGTKFALSDVGECKVLAFYQTSLREPLFSALLGVAAFLFSLQTFIIVTMKEKVYDTPKYEERLALLRSLNPKIARYAPLRNFSGLLFWSILLSLFAAVAQFSLGVLDSSWGMAAALALSVWAIAMFFVSLLYLQANLKDWFDFEEAEPEKKDGDEN